MLKGSRTFFLKENLFIWLLWVLLQRMVSSSHQAGSFAALQTLLSRGGHAPKHAGFSSSSTQAQELWHAGLVALQHVGP